ncbi:aminoglycoside adenylyltransferase domain-containing protein [Acidiphilium sp.]|uniref:aminoglycoside adenylyltransferase domain-containing protein n=1 Tax=Acidiphilium sp. TaxID=527 RepID=UPI003D05A4E5
MSMQPRLPHAAARLVSRYQEALAGAGIDAVRGLYLVGSVALGDYQENHSDVDFVAVTDRPIVPDLVEPLAGLHARLHTGRRPAFDGIYLEASRLSQTPGAAEIGDYTVRGEFHTGQPCFEINPATYLGLVQSGIVVFGPPVPALDIAIDMAALRRFQLDHLQGSWARWVQRSDAALLRMDHDADIAAAPLAWGVLGMLRIACTLATGRIVSKTAAGRWALGVYPPKWRNVIEEALAVRRGEAPMLTRARAGSTIDFLRFVLASHPVAMGVG